MTCSVIEIASLEHVIMARLRERYTEGKSTLATFGDLWRWCRAADPHMPSGPSADRTEFSRRLHAAIRLLQASKMIWAYRAGEPGSEKIIHVDLTAGGRVFLGATAYGHQDRLGKLSEEMEERDWHAG